MRSTEDDEPGGRRFVPPAGRRSTHTMGDTVTALVFVLDRESVVLGMDSLAIRATDKTPSLYASKILPVPHLGAVVCGTGSQRLPLDWFVHIETRILGRDIDYVNSVAPGELRGLWTRLDEPGTATIYHFGYSPAEDAYVGYAFRSESDFAAERIQYGIGIKPPSGELIAVAADSLAELGVHDAIISLIVKARSVDDALPLEERVGIGGEVHLLTLTGGRQFGWATRPWADFDAVFGEMLERLRADNATDEGATRVKHA